MTFYELLKEHFFFILFLVFSPYIFYYIFRLYKIGKSKIKAENNPYLSRTTIEEEELGIIVENSDPKKYKKRIEILVDLLKNTKGKISITAAEAIMLVEIFSSKISISQNGELVISFGTANEFALSIYNDPMKFITYIKSVEERVNLDYINNKIDLGEVLYMLRNARKFGLEMDKEDESDLIITIKSAIYKSELQDVIIDIVEDNNKQSVNFKDEVLINTYSVDENNAKEIKQEIQDKKDEEKLLKENDNIASVIRLENGHIIVTSKDGVVIEKDDLNIYSVYDPAEENNQNNNDKTSSGGTSNLSNLVNDAVGKMLNISDENSITTTENETVNISPVEKEIKKYIRQYGELCYFENKYKDDLKFKDRAKRMLTDERLFCYKSFEPKNFDTKNFFQNEGMFKIFLSSLFNIKNAISENFEIPYVFIGDLNLKNKEPIRFISIDVHYIIVSIYLSMSREDRESFYRFVFLSSGKKINTLNLTSILENINIEFNLFLEQNGGFLVDSIYSYSGKTIKTNIIRIEISTFEKYLKEDDDIKKNYTLLKQKLLTKISVEAFGKKALTKSADVTIEESTFFRKKIVFENSNELNTEKGNVPF